MSGRTPEEPVRRRLVLMMPGFERVPLEAQCRRFAREAAKTAASFGIGFECSPAEISGDECRTARFILRARGRGWSTDTEVVIYELARINALYEERPLVTRFTTGFMSLFELLVTGTAFRYLCDGWRFYLFYLFPFLFLLGAATCLALLGLPFYLHDAAHLAWTLPALLALVLILLFAGKRNLLPLTMDLWTLTTDSARGRRPELQAFLQAITRDATARIADTDAEEVIAVGHSYGVVPAVMALAQQPVRDLSARTPVGLITAGSYLLAVARHPAAKALRKAVAAVVGARMAWLDAQSHTDPVNFFRTNPATALGVKEGRLPSIIEVRFRQQLTPETYRKIRGDFFRTHRQFVFGVEKRSAYALFAIIGGPERFSDVAARPGLSPDWERYESAPSPKGQDKAD